MNKYDFDWSDLAFSSKKPLKDLKAIFIAAPRELSVRRFTQLVKEWLPKGNILLGIAKEDFIDGFIGQPHFRALQQSSLQVVIDKVNQSSSSHKIYTLRYFQRETNFILQKIPFKHRLFVSGSWHKTFHTLPVYYTLANQHASYQLVSPFFDEQEAKDYTGMVETEIRKAFPLPRAGSTHSGKQMMEVALLASVYSFDYNFQTGLSLGLKSKTSYSYITATYNSVVPFQGYAMHYGAARETHFSPPHDVNHYDTVHAEVNLIVQAATSQLSLKDTTLFINTLPCPTCSRMFTQTPIQEFVYQNDHSDGYAIGMLQAAGKKVRRFLS